MFINFNSKHNILDLSKFANKFAYSLNNMNPSNY